MIHSRAGLLWWRRMVLPATRSRRIWRSSRYASCCRGRCRGSCMVQWWKGFLEISWDSSAITGQIDSLEHRGTCCIARKKSSTGISSFRATNVIRFVRVSGYLKLAILWKRKLWWLRSVIPLRSTKKHLASWHVYWRGGEEVVDASSATCARSQKV